MSKMKSFLDRRSENLKSPKNEPIEKVPEKDPPLTDDEFWAILQRLKETQINSKKDPIEILEALLNPYTDEQVDQFSEMYQRLNS